MESHNDNTQQTPRPHPLQKKRILYGYPQLNDTPHQLANYLLVLAKSTIDKIYMATNITHRQTQTTGDCSD
jgi:hypothetical protein